MRLQVVSDSRVISDKRTTKPRGVRQTNRKEKRRSGLPTVVRKTRTSERGPQLRYSARSVGAGSISPPAARVVDLLPVPRPKPAEEQSPRGEAASVTALPSKRSAAPSSWKQHSVKPPNKVHHFLGRSQILLRGLHSIRCRSPVLTNASAWMKRDDGSGAGLRFFRARDVEIDHDGILSAADDDRLAGLVGTGVYFLMRNPGWNENEIAWAGFIRKFQMIAPAETARPRTM